MRAGWLRHRVEIQEKTVTRDAYGEEDFTWETVDTIWASVEPARGRDLMQQQTEQVLYDTIVRMRYGTTVTPENRLVYSGQYYDVRSVISIMEKNKELEAQCIRVYV